MKILQVLSATFCFVGLTVGGKNASVLDSATVYANLSDTFFDPDYMIDDWPQKGPLEKLDIALVVVYGIVIVVGIIANVIVFFVILCGPEAGRSITTIYVLQLAIADTVFLVTLPIFSMQKLNEGSAWNLGEGWCAFCQTVKYCNYYAGVIFLTAMSVDRFIAVRYSATLMEIRTKTSACIVCVVVWVAACLLSIPVMLYARIETLDGLTYCRVMFPGYTTVNNASTELLIRGWYDGEAIEVIFGAEESSEDPINLEELELSTTNINDSDYQYHCNFENQPQAYNVWLVLDTLIAFIIPFGVIVFMYSTILIHMRKVENNLGNTRMMGSRRHHRITKMVAALVSCFAICWLPHHILTLAKISGFPSSPLVCHALEEFFTALAFSNSALNPILYTFLGYKFKDRLRQSFRNSRSIVKWKSRESSIRRSARSHPEDTAKGNMRTVFYRNSPSEITIRDCNSTRLLSDEERKPT